MGLIRSIAVVVVAIVLNSCHGRNRFVGIGDGSETKEYTVFSQLYIANTGMAYDYRSNSLLIAAWDSTTDRDFIRFTDMRINTRRDLELQGIVKFVQGISCDKQFPYIWVWGTHPNRNFSEWTDCFRLCKIDFNGNLVEEFETPMPERYPGMIAMTNDGKIWMKANTKTIARQYDPNNGMALLKTVETGIAGEGIAVDNLGNIWVHGNCAVKKINPDTLASQTWASPNLNCAEEGMVFDGEGYLWLGSDDGYHYNQAGGNKVWRMEVN